MHRAYLTSASPVKFCVKDKKESKGRNPAIGEDAILPARRVVTFKCSGKLRQRVNGG